MKLFDVPRNTWIKTNLGGNILFFDHIDGMYSVCKNEQGDTIHLAAWTEVEIIEHE